MIILCVLNPTYELQQYIERTFDEDLIQQFYFERQEFNELLEIGSEATLN
jgi:hypothetical protein